MLLLRDAKGSLGLIPQVQKFVKGEVLFIRQEIPEMVERSCFVEEKIEEAVDI